MTKQKQRKQGKSKRWFAAASGWGLNLEMGSAEMTHKQKRSYVPLPFDAKVYETNGTVAAANFLHNTIYTANVLGAITPGNTYNTRIGDKINLKTVSLKFLADTATATTATAPVYVRLMLVASTKQSNPANFASGLGSSDLYQGSPGNQVMGRVDSKLVKLLCDEVIYINSTAAVVGSMGIGHIECAINSYFEYQINSSYGQAANLYFIAIPFVTGGTTGVTQCGSFQYDFAVSYTDN